MIAPPEAPDRTEVQRLVPFGYPLNCSRQFVLRVTNSAKSRRFVEELVAQRFITTAEVDTEGVRKLTDERRCPANIGFTYRGLEKLELGVPYRRVFEEK